jgi:NAD(P)-dependent dehydrogenase (short-subunit alcohol dehydrogenase family)
MDSGWKGQVALVTGAARGIGRATARMLAAQGVAVGVNYVAQADAAETLVAEVRGQGGQAIAVGADVADAGAVAGMVRRVEAELGPITILVNNAGIAWPATLDSWEPKGFARLHAVNVGGVIHCTRAVVPGMRARGYGRIINVGSVAGLVMASAPGNHFYAGTKAEVMALTKRFAFELGSHGITVNAVAPGYVRTDINRGFLTDEEYKARDADFVSRAMIGRAGEPDDIANAIVFFAFPASGWITAQVLVVDGGRKDFIGHG